MKKIKPLVGVVAMGIFLITPTICENYFPVKRDNNFCSVNLEKNKSSFYETYFLNRLEYVLVRDGVPDEFFE